MLFLFNASVCAILVNTNGGLEQFSGTATRCIQSETMKLLWSSQQKSDKDKKSENVSALMSAEVVLVNSNVAYNKYKKDSRNLTIFVSEKSFGK